MRLFAFSREEGSDERNPWAVLLRMPWARRAERRHLLVLATILVAFVALRKPWPSGLLSWGVAVGYFYIFFLLELPRGVLRRIMRSRLFHDAQVSPWRGRDLVAAIHHRARWQLAFCWLLLVMTLGINAVWGMQQMSEPIGVRERVSDGGAEVWELRKPSRYVATVSVEEHRAIGASLFPAYLMLNISVLVLAGAALWFSYGFNWPWLNPDNWWVFGYGIAALGLYVVGLVILCSAWEAAGSIFYSSLGWQHPRRWSPDWNLLLAGGALSVWHLGFAIFLWRSATRVWQEAGEVHRDGILEAERKRPWRLLRGGN